MGQGVLEGTPRTTHTYGVWSTEQVWEKMETQSPGRWTVRDGSQLWDNKAWSVKHYVTVTIIPTLEIECKCTTALRKSGPLNGEETWKLNVGKVTRRVYLQPLSL